jgi:DNA-binding NtrC family response regulator
MKRTVFLVDDNENILQMTAEILGMHGFKVVYFSKFEKAFFNLKAWIRGRKKFVILSDMELDEGHTGLELYSYLKEHDYLYRIPFILYSASVSSKEEIDILGREEVDFIPKPFKIEDIIKILSQKFFLLENQLLNNKVKIIFSERRIFRKALSTPKVSTMSKRKKLNDEMKFISKK